MVTSINSLSIGRGAKKKRYGQKGCSPRADANDRGWWKKSMLFCQKKNRILSYLVMPR